MNIKPSPMVAITRRNVDQLIDFTKAVTRLKTSEAEIVMMKALELALRPPVVIKSDDIQQELNALMPGGVEWKKP